MKKKDANVSTHSTIIMYLKQKGLKISGSKVELIDRVLTHARGNLSARDAVEHEESPNPAKTTQAQSPVIRMTLQMTLRHTSKSHLK